MSFLQAACIAICLNSLTDSDQIAQIIILKKT